MLKSQQKQINILEEKISRAILMELLDETNHNLGALTKQHYDLDRKVEHEYTSKVFLNERISKVEEYISKNYVEKKIFQAFCDKQKNEIGNS